MIHLAFNARAIPRTTTRQQWREIDRARRTWERAIRAELKRARPETERRLANLFAFGTTHPEAFL